MPPFSKLFLYSGNLMKHPTLLPSTHVQARTTDELLTSLHDALSQSLNSKQPQPAVNNKTLDLRGHDPANGSERVTKDDIDITVKLFYPQPDSHPVAYLSEALSCLSNLFDTTAIDTFILAFAELRLNDSSEEDDPSESNALVDYLNVWSEVEKRKEAGQFKSVGVSDFSKELLTTFLEKAKIPPNINQINLTDCCVLPRDFIAFAKKHGIELLTHGDEQTILSNDATKSLLEKHGLLEVQNDGLYASGAIKPRWILRYSAVIRGRGVVTHKGYIVMAATDDHARSE